MSAPLQLRTHYPIPTRNRLPSNITVRGFNDPMDRWLGFPPDALFTPGAREKFRDFGQHLDPRRNATFVRHDLALKYYYETVEEWLIEGEWRSFPITHTVYRRDRELLRTEIEDYLRHKTIPARYPPRVGDGVIHEPMNQDNFERMMSRFSLRSIILTFSPPRFRPFTMTVERLYERSSGLEVQHHHLDFEERFWSSVYFKQYTEPGYFQRESARDRRLDNPGSPGLGPAVLAFARPAPRSSSPGTNPSSTTDAWDVVVRISSVNTQHYTPLLSRLCVQLPLVSFTAARAGSTLVFYGRTCSTDFDAT
ncbi:hypothetical protein C8R46DRAFT_1353299 [Mycena filopes]|nr:hypothetical protein C8R46DRAFT_1353299 [Mycena filopes]